MSIERESIDPDADKVVRRLNRAGYKAYLVGGCVRDLLLQREPKDFDVSTSATPKEIRALFRNCRIIGRRFRLAHIFFGPKIIETSTFRANPRQGADASDDAELLIRRDNVFGSETEDAKRRDFTINGLFYHVETERVIDHVGGLSDLDARVVRTIGDPDIRFREDPVRMLRAIKFAARLGFTIEPVTYAALVRHRHEINKCAAPRVLEEFYRLMRGGAARRSLELLIETGVAATLSPHLAALLGTATSQLADDDEVDDEAGLFSGEEEDDDFTGERDASSAAPELPLEPHELLERRAASWKLVEQIDQRVQSGHPVSNPVALAAIIGPFLFEDLIAQGVRPIEANERALQILQPLVAELHIARRDAERARQILIAQRRLAPSRRRRGRPMAMVRRDYFPEALVLYEMVARAEDRGTEDIERWHRLSDGAGSRTEDPQRAGRKRRRRRRGGRRRRPPTDELAASPSDDSESSDPAAG